MLNQFRSQYPQGGLTSELVQIDHGFYIVRAIVEVEGRILATGLAAKATLEEAEDQARLRALALLNLEPIASASLRLTEVPAKKVEAPVTPAPAPTSKKSTAKKVIIPPGPLPLEIEPEPSPIKPEPIPEPEAKIEETLTQKAEPAVADVEEQPEPAIAEAHDLLVPLNLEPELSLPSEPEPMPSTPPLLKLVPEPSSPPLATVSSDEPIDFSEIIARSNVELKRLGWTNDQGRNYLLQTYGKRSRQLLSDEELIEFLQYLETQPTPN